MNLEMEKNVNFNAFNYYFCEKSLDLDCKNGLSSLPKNQTMTGGEDHL
jgi:hypothetical protein